MNIIKYIKAVFSRSSGQALVEYALIATFVGLALVWVSNNYYESTKVNYYNGMVPLSKGQAIPSPPEGKEDEVLKGNKKPVAVIDGPLSGSIGKTLTFTDTSYDLDGTITYTTWGTKTIERTFHSAGTYRIELEVVDNEGAKGKVEIEVVITESKPVAVITKNQEMKISQSTSLTIHGKNSFDPAGDKLVYAKWFLTNPNGSRQEMSWTLDGHTFAAGQLSAGIYKVELQVVDEFQTESEWTIMTFQVNIPPVAKITISPISKTVNLGAPVIISSTGSYDPDGDALTQAKWTLIRPDGSRISMNWGLNTPNSYLATTSGTYKVELQVKDAFNDWSTTVMDAFLVKTNPTAVIKHTPVKSSYSSTETISFNGLQSHDPDGDSITQVEWYRTKNGVRTQLSWNINGGNFIAKNISGSGSYKFELRVKDSSGMWSDYTSVTINIANNAPTVNLYNSAPYGTIRSSEGDSYFVSPNSNIQLYATASDPDGDSIAQAEWYLIKDGVRTQLNFTTISGGTINTSQFSQNGTNIIEVKVRDSGGLWSTVKTRQYVVNAKPVISAQFTYGPWPLRVDTSGTHDPDGQIVQIEIRREVFRTNGQSEIDYVNWNIGVNYVYGHSGNQIGDTAYFYFRVKDNKGEWSDTDVQGYLVSP